MNARRLGGAGLLGALVASIAYWRRALTLDGAVAAAVIGAVVFARGGVPAAASLLAFFSTSSVLSRIREERKRSSPLVQAKGARRDAWQVLANGGWATASIALGQKQAFVGALAAAAADTWATEIGMLAGRQPRSIVTLLPVPTGTSSGVTPEGLLASLIGGVVVGVSWSIFGGGRRGVLVAAVAGSCGSVVDSLIGATLQALYRCRACNQLTESRRHPACGGLAESLRGYGWINNDAVNSMATLTGAVVGGLIGSRPDAARHVRGGG